MSADQFKRAAAAAAVELVRPGMTLGLGTGSTAAHFISLVAERYGVAGGLQCVPTSEATGKAAVAAGLEVIAPDETTRIDLAVDGADEIGPELSLIKGGGGALLREKIVAAAADQFIVIADESKIVRRLGAFPLPLEVEPALWGLTVSRIRDALGELAVADAPLRLRSDAEGEGAFLTDGGRYIVDVSFGAIDDPAAVNAALGSVPGVLETGLFLGLADGALVAGPDGVRRL
ncbi:MAG: ribose-5-phosphate isomerase RpiA [Pseudomonadota bacterium]